MSACLSKVFVNCEVKSEQRKIRTDLSISEVGIGNKALYCYLVCVSDTRLLGPTRSGPARPFPFLLGRFNLWKRFAESGLCADPGAYFNIRKVRNFAEKITASSLNPRRAPPILLTATPITIYPLPILPSILPFSLLSLITHTFRAKTLANK